MANREDKFLGADMKIWQIGSFLPAEAGRPCVQSNRGPGRGSVCCVSRVSLITQAVQKKIGAGCVLANYFCLDMLCLSATF